jgi:HEAT repeat protein
MFRRLLPVLLLFPLLATSAQAGLSTIWHKDPRPNPNERVPQLLRTLRSDGDESKRAAAAEELRQYDPAAFPEMIPVLLEALQKDSKPSVRVEAVQTLARLRPVSQQIGQTLEQVRDKDPSMRVRLQARKELLSYHWHGYRSGKPEEGTAGTPSYKEPPLAPQPPLAPDARSTGKNTPPPAPVPVPTTITSQRPQLPPTPIPSNDTAPPRGQGPELPPPN